MTKIEHLTRPPFPLPAPPVFTHRGHSVKAPPSTDTHPPCNDPAPLGDCGEPLDCILDADHPGTHETSNGTQWHVDTTDVYAWAQRTPIQRVTLAVIVP